MTLEQTIVISILVVIGVVSLVAMGYFVQEGEALEAIVALLALLLVLLFGIGIMESVQLETVKQTCLSSGFQFISGKCYTLIEGIITEVRP